MDFLECKICNVPFDEEDHRPRHAPCGHSLCSLCLKALIKDRIFECPRCRQKNNINVPDDLPVNYDLIEVIRAFNIKSNLSAKETKIIISVATNDELCNIHCKPISHWCYICEMWICIECLEAHSTILGCVTDITTSAIKNMKGKHIECANTVLAKFEKDTKLVLLKIQEHADKKKELLERAEKHHEEEKKLYNLLEKGKLEKDELVKSKKHLNEANSHHAVSDYIKLLTQRKQILRSWSIKTLGMNTQMDILKTLKEGKSVYVECVIKNMKLVGKFSLHGEHFKFHKFQTQTIEDGCTIVPFDQLQEMIPSTNCLVFIELSLGGTVKGHVVLRLNKNLPNIKENMVTIFTGQQGVSLSGVKSDNKESTFMRFSKLPFSNLPVNPDSIARSTANRGDVVGYYVTGSLSQIFLLVSTHEFSSHNKVIGSVEAGMDIMRECYDKFYQGVVISDCGLIINQE